MIANFSLEVWKQTVMLRTNDKIYATAAWKLTILVITKLFFKNVAVMFNPPVQAF